MRASSTDRILLATLAVSVCSLPVYDSEFVRAPNRGKRRYARRRLPSQTDSGKQITRTDFGGQTAGSEFLGYLVPAVYRGNAVAEPVCAERWRTPAWWCSGSASTRTRRRISDFCSRAGPLSRPRAIPKADIAADYGTFKWPETYVINRDGKVVEKYIGPQTGQIRKIVAAIKGIL